ncbi:MAG: SET domain-containing methyltransferase [Pseudomonadota bacterium]
MTATLQTQAGPAERRADPQTSRVEPASASPDVTVRETDDRGKGVFALRAFAPGERVARGRAIAPSPTRTRHSLQMDWSRHVLFDEPGRLINHSCDPNTGVRDNDVGGYDFIALRPIAEGEEISFDYATTEYESIAVEQCLCGAKTCRGRSGGYSFLPSDHPAKVAGLIAGYILRGDAR